MISKAFSLCTVPGPVQVITYADDANNDAYIWADRNKKTGEWEKEEDDDYESAESDASTADELNPVKRYKVFRQLYKKHHKELWYSFYKKGTSITSIEVIGVPFLGFTSIDNQLII